MAGPKLSTCVTVLSVICFQSLLENGAKTKNAMRRENLIFRPLQEFRERYKYKEEMLFIKYSVNNIAIKQYKDKSHHSSENVSSELITEYSL